MRRLRVFVVTMLLIGVAATADAQSSAFRFRPGKVPVGRTFHYVKSNLDGSDPEQVAIWFAGRDSIEVFKYHPGNVPAGLVGAHLDWQWFHASRLFSQRAMRGDTLLPVARLAYDAERNQAEVEILAASQPPVRVAIGGEPVHVFSFELASLNAAMPHLANPRSSFRVWLADPSYGDGPVFRDRGPVQVTWTGLEARNGVPCHAYAIEGPGLERGGRLWVSRSHGLFEDVEIGTPNHPDWSSFKFDLQRVERMDRAAWDAFRRAAVAARP